MLPRKSASMPYILIKVTFLLKIGKIKTLKQEEIISAYENNFCRYKRSNILHFGQSHLQAKSCQETNSTMYNTYLGLLLGEEENPPPFFPHKFHFLMSNIHSASDLGQISKNMQQHNKIEQPRSHNCDTWLLTTAYCNRRIV